MRVAPAASAAYSRIFRALWFMFSPAHACGCGYRRRARRAGGGRGLPAVGTAEPRGVVGSITDSRLGRLPSIRSLISSPVNVSNSSRPLASVFEIGALFGEDLLGFLETGLDQPPHFGVDLAARSPRNVLLARDRVAEEHLLLVLAIGDGAERVGEAPARHHHTRKLGRLLDVGGGAGGHLLMAEHKFLGDAAAHHDRKARGHLLSNTQPNQ